MFCLCVDLLPSAPRIGAGGPERFGAQGSFVAFAPLVRFEPFRLCVAFRPSAPYMGRQGQFDAFEICEAAPPWDPEDAKAARRRVRRDDSPIPGRAMIRLTDVTPPAEEPPGTRLGHSGPVGQRTKGGNVAWPDTVAWELQSIESAGEKVMSMNYTHTAASDEAAASAYELLHDARNAGPFVHVLLDYIHEEVDDQYAWCLGPRVAPDALGRLGRKHFEARWSARLRDQIAMAIKSMAGLLAIPYEKMLEEVELGPICPLCQAIGTLTPRLVPGEVIWEVVCSECEGRVVWQEL